jgi:type I restriction enzyme R subunit
LVSLRYVLQNVLPLLNQDQQDFMAFVLNTDVEDGVDELDHEKLPVLLSNLYQSLADAQAVLGNRSEVRKLFIECQQHLYNQRVA